MKQYESYMERQEVSASFHEKLLTLESPARRSGGWRRTSGRRRFARRCC